MLHRLLAPSPHNILPHILVCLLKLRFSKLNHHIDCRVLLPEIDPLNLLVHTDRRVPDDTDDARGGLANEVADAFSETW